MTLVFKDLIVEIDEEIKKPQTLLKITHCSLKKW